MRSCRRTTSIEEFLLNGCDLGEVFRLMASSLFMMALQIRREGAVSNLSIRRDEVPHEVSLRSSITFSSS